MLALLKFTNRIHYLHSTSCNGDSQAITLSAHGVPALLPCPLTWYQVRNREALINTDTDRVNTLRHWVKRNWHLFCLLPKQHTEWPGFKAGSIAQVRGVQLSTDVWCVLLSLEQIYLCRFPEHCCLWKEVGRASALGAWREDTLPGRGCRDARFCTAFQQV